MRCIVVDDEPLARQGMELLISKVPDLELLGLFASVLEADKFIKNNIVDLIFLDIQMPLLTGIDFLKINPNIPMVVITSAYPDYALESFEFNVIDYLTKPIRFERFFKAISKCKSTYDLSKKDYTNESGQKEGESIFIRSNRKYIRVFFNKISYIEALKDYVIVHYESERIAVSVNLKSIESKLPKNKFIRVSKSIIINVDFIKSIDNNTICLQDVEFYIGDNYRENVMKLINDMGLIRRNY